MSHPALRVTELSKRYRIGTHQGGDSYRTFREAIGEALTAPVRRMRSLKRAASWDASIWALRDVSLDVPPGEVLGIIGRNGAGKSTFLKILSRITEPTEGRVEIYGRVASLLEVGTGFHPELTGRENIFLNGAILGMKRREMQRKFDEIVAFAEVEKFIDTPVKRYSSGMYLRLAFAVAAHLEPEILLVDEVLAVGDAAFQKKCLGKMAEVAYAGRTVLLVSHNLGAIQGLCKSAVLLADGHVRVYGDPGGVVAAYLHTAAARPASVVASDPAWKGLCIENVVFRNGRGDVTTDFHFGDSLTVDIHFYAKEKIVSPYFWVGIVSQYGPLISANGLLDGIRPDYIQGKGVISCRFLQLPLLPQIYTIDMGVRAADGASMIIKGTNVGSLQVVGTAHEIGLCGETADVAAWTAAPVIVPYEWRLPSGDTVPVDPLSAGPHLVTADR